MSVYELGKVFTEESETCTEMLLVSIRKERR